MGASDHRYDGQRRRRDFLANAVSGDDGERVVT